MLDARDDFEKLDTTFIAARDGGKPVMTFGLKLHLLIGNGERPEQRAAVIDVAERYADWAGDRITRYMPHHASSRSRLGRGGVRAAYEAECAALDAEIEDFGPMLVGNEEVSNIGFDALLLCAQAARRRPHSPVNARFPATSARTEPDRLINVILDWCNRLRPMQGTLGLSPLFELGMERSYPHVLWPFLSRFIGLDYTWAWFMALGQQRRIKCVNWLTVIDDGMVAELGGQGALAEALGPDIRLYRWDGGVLIRAGAEPRLGDRDADSWPADYLTVNRVLRPLRFEDYPASPVMLLKVPPPLDARDETLRWVRRFDRD
jgi:hypothetical protein